MLHFDEAVVTDTSFVLSLNLYLFPGQFLPALILDSTRKDQTHMAQLGITCCSFHLQQIQVYPLSCPHPLTEERPTVICILVGLQNRMVARPTCSPRHQPLTSTQQNKNKLANIRTLHDHASRQRLWKPRQAAFAKARANEGTRFRRVFESPDVPFPPTQVRVQRTVLF